MRLSSFSKQTNLYYLKLVKILKQTWLIYYSARSDRLSTLVLNKSNRSGTKKKGWARLPVEIQTKIRTKVVQVCPIWQEKVKMTKPHTNNNGLISQASRWFESTLHSWVSKLTEIFPNNTAACNYAPSHRRSRQSMVYI